MAQSLSTWHRALNALKALKVGMKMPVFFGRNAHINLLLDIHSFICLLFHSASLIRNFPVAGLELGARYQKISGRWQLLGGVIQTSVRHGLSHCGAHYLSSIFPFTDILDLLCSRYWELHTGKCWVFFFFSYFWIGYQLQASLSSSSGGVCLCYLTRHWVLWTQRHEFYLCVFSGWYIVSFQQMSDLGMTGCINVLLNLLWLLSLKASSILPLT